MMKGTKFLSELVTNPADILPGKINIVEANVSAGKTYFALTTIPHWAGSPEKVLYLIDTNNGELRLQQNIITVSRLAYGLAEYGKDRHWGEPLADVKGKIPVMTYAGFGSEILRAKEAFWEKFEIIVCDEIQNLVKYLHMNGEKQYLKQAESTLRALAVKGKTRIIALSATPQLARKHFGVLCHDVPFDRDSLVQYDTFRTETYTGIETILPKLVGKTGILYTEQVRQMKDVIGLAGRNGIRAEGFWSLNDETQKTHPMTWKQLELRDTVLREETIPEDIDLLVINRASETCIKLQGSKRKVDYMIIHYAQTETQIQVRGRYCGDIPVLYLHSTDVDASKIEVPECFLGKSLFLSDKKELCRILNIPNPKGQRYQWRKVRTLLQEGNYRITEGRIHNKRYAKIQRKQTNTD